MAFGEEARMLLEMEASDKQQTKLIHQLGRIATALERDVDRQADAALIEKLMAYMFEERKISLMVSERGYYHRDWYTGVITKVAMGMVTLLHQDQGALSVFRVSNIRGITEQFEHPAFEHPAY